MFADACTIIALLSEEPEAGCAIVPGATASTSVTVCIALAPNTKAYRSWPPTASFGRPR
jgi:hypothetical protein